VSPVESSARFRVSDVSDERSRSVDGRARTTGRRRVVGWEADLRDALRRGVVHRLLRGVAVIGFHDRVHRARVARASRRNGAAPLLGRVNGRFAFGGSERGRAQRRTLEALVISPPRAPPVAPPDDPAPLREALLPARGAPRDDDVVDEEACVA
jgi:hypothetical protein